MTPDQKAVILEARDHLLLLWGAPSRYAQKKIASSCDLTDFVLTASLTASALAASAGRVKPAEAAIVEIATVIASWSDKMESESHRMAGFSGLSEAGREEVDSLLKLIRWYISRFQAQVSGAASSFEQVPA